MKHLLKKHLYILLAFLMFTTTLAVPVVARSHSFADVQPGRWYADAVQFMYEHNIMQGPSATSFDPSGAFTRAATTATLFRIYHERMATTDDGRDNHFHDVSTGWYAPYVTWAYQTEIVTGASPTRFLPNDSITRQEFATMLFRYADFAATGHRLGYADLDRFTDSYQIASWANMSMHWAVYNGILQGTGTRLEPTRGITRAEAAMMLARFLDAEFGTGDNGDNEENQPPAWQSQYSYSLHILTPLRQYTRNNIILFVKTDNPDPESISIGGGQVGLWFLDIEFTGNGVILRSVPGGYVISATVQQVGPQQISLRERIPGLPDREWPIMATVAFTARCSEEAFDNMIDEIIANATNSNMTTYQKLRAVESYILTNFRYPLNTYGYESPWRVIQTIPTNLPVWHGRTLDSWSAPDLLCVIAIRLGVPAEDAQWAVPGQHYSTARVIIDGVHHFFNPTPFMDTNNIDPATIPMFDFSQFQ